MPIQRGTKRCAGGASFHFKQLLCGILTGQEVDMDRIAVAPIAADLQDRRARQAPMREKGGLAKSNLAMLCQNVRRYAG